MPMTKLHINNERIPDDIQTLLVSLIGNPKLHMTEDTESQFEVKVGQVSLIIYKMYEKNDIV